MLTGGEGVTGERRRTVVRRRPCILERDPMMPTRHTPIVSRRPFIDWSRGSIVSRPGTNVSRLPIGVGAPPSSATENPDEGGRTGNVPARVASSVWPCTRDVWSHPLVDSRLGSIPTGAGTNDWRPGSLATRETFIPTRETIVAGRETIVPERETTLARGAGIDDCAHTHVPTRPSVVAMGLGSDVCHLTPRGQRDSFEPAHRGRAPLALGIASLSRGDRPQPPTVRSRPRGDRSPARGDGRPYPILRAKALLLRSFASLLRPHPPHQGDSPRAQCGTTRSHRPSTHSRPPRNIRNVHHQQNDAW